MNHATKSTLTGVQGFLSAVSEYCIPHIRSAHDFLEVFPPTMIMECVEDAEVRANILHATVGTRVEIGRKTSTRSAAEHLTIALSEGLAEPEVVLELLSADHRVTYFDATDLWPFIVETKFWEGDEADTVRIANARNMFVIMLEAGLKYALVTSEEIVRAISFAKILEGESKVGLIQTIEALTIAGTEDRFKLLLERYTPKKIVSVVDLGLIWQNVIHPLIAVRRGLIGQGVDQGHSIPVAVEASEAIQPIAESAKAITAGSSPIASSQPFSRGSISSLSSMGSPLHTPIHGARASSVPAASRSNNVSSPPTKEEEPKDPKADEVSDATVSDADDDGMQVDDSELDDSGRISSIVSEDSSKVETTQQELTEPESTEAPDIAAATSDSEALCVQPSEEAPIQLVNRTSSSTFPAVRQPPRPSTNPRLHQTGSSDIEMLVEDGSMNDPEVIAALESEQRSKAFRSTGDSEVAHISDDAFSQAGGMTKSDPRPREEEASITSVEGKTAVCMLLRSKEVGLKLGSIDMFDCQIRRVLLIALEEIDPALHRDAQKQYEKAENKDLGNVLCSDLEKRSPVAAIKLRALLVGIDCASAPEPLSHRPGRPPPLPPQPKPTQSSRFSSGGKGR